MPSLNMHRDGDGNWFMNTRGMTHSQKVREGISEDPLADAPTLHKEMSAADMTRARLDTVMTKILATNRGGERTEALRVQRERDADFFERVYSYWIYTIFAIRGRPFPFLPLLIYLAYSSAVISFALYYLDPQGSLDELRGYKPEMKDVVVILGLAVFFLLTFRTNQSYSRWWEGATKFYDLCSQVRDASRQIAAIIPTQQAIELLWWAFAALYCAKQQLRGLEASEDYELLAEVLPPRFWEELEAQPDKFHWSLYCYHRIATRINYFRTTEDRGCQEVMKATIPMVAHYGACWRILRTPMPFAYLTHLRVFLVGWLALLPWTFAISYGWWTLLLCGFAGYGLLGVEEGATEIEQPFGGDVNDLPLDYMAASTFKLVSQFILHVGYDSEGRCLDGKVIHVGDEKPPAVAVVSPIPGVDDKKGGDEMC